MSETIMQYKWLIRSDKYNFEISFKSELTGPYDITNMEIAFDDWLSESHETLPEQILLSSDLRYGMYVLNDDKIIYRMEGYYARVNADINNDLRMVK